ncbi:DUF3390 domain-containing protein [bacterium]|nr:DUF3390 domain-containing protein [bacterium]
MSHGLPTQSLKKQMFEELKRRGDGPLNYKQNTQKSVRARDARAAEWPDFEDRRDRITNRRQSAVENLPALHEQLVARWEENGVTAHYAADAGEAAGLVVGLIQKTGVDRIVKSKSMLTEEIGLNNALEQAGIHPVETDLGEYIVQLRGEVPSHITMPAMHLNRRDVGRLFAEKLGVPYTDDPPTLTRYAREALRKEFLSARVGICGVNFAVAETGHIATVTNEGNGRMVTSQPDMVIALMGWERVTQSLGDLAELWQLLSRSGTGQRTTVYLNLMQGPAEGPTGPREVHIVVVDNGRKKVHADREMQEVLRCIRCGACQNACPVYRQVGGHPYGGVYAGPIGKVLEPALHGVDEAPHHPFASSLCGACEEICPVKIPIPKLLLDLRHKRVGTRSKHDPEHTVWRVYREVMSEPGRYEAAARVARGAQRLFPGGAMPIPGWTDHREAPKFAAQSFREWYAGREQKDER